MLNSDSNITSTATTAINVSMLYYVNDVEDGNHGNQVNDVFQKPTFGYRVVSERLFAILKIFNTAVHFPIPMGGIIGNALCVRTFYRMGLKEGVTILFFNLAIADLWLSITTSILTISQDLTIILHFLAGFNYIFYGVDMYAINHPIASFHSSFVNIQQGTIVFLAVQRGVCVILPLKFKMIFTRRFTIILLSFIWLYGLTDLFIRYLTIKFARYYLPWNMVIFVTLITNPKYVSVVRYYSKFIRYGLKAIIAPVCQGTVVVSLIIMTIGLTRSVRFKTSMMSKRSATSESEEKAKGDKEGMKVVPTENSKERQAILQVSILCGVYILSILPITVLEVVYNIFPEMRHDYRYKYFQFTFLDFNKIATSVHASINFFIYFKCSTNFKQTFRKKSVPRR